MPRRFGPVQGAGTAIIERESGAQIVPSSLGTTCYIGVTEKGEMGEILDCPKQKQFLRKCGSFVENGELPDNAFDFYQFSEGAGRLFVVRVTDGTEVPSTDWMLSRHNGDGEYANRDLSGEQKRTLLRVTAKSGGRWGGAQRVLSFDVALPGDLTETTIDTGETMLVDEYKGATLQLLGVTTRTYEVISNDDAGVLTVKPDSRMASDLAAESPTNDSAVVYLDTETRQFTATGVSAGDPKSLSLKWKDGEENQNTLFGLDILVDGLIVRSYNNLSLDPNDKWYIDEVVNNDPDNDFIDVEIIWNGTFDADHRPANWWGTYKLLSAATITAEIAHVRSVTPAGATDPGFVSDFVYPAKTVRQRLTLTFLDDVNFTVATDAEYGAEHVALPNGTVGQAYAVDLAADDKANLDTLPTFTVFEGTDPWATGDVVVIDIDPFPVDLASGEGLLSGSVILDGDNANSERAVIDSNTVNTITLKNSPIVAPTSDSGLADEAIVSTGAISFATTGGNIELVTDIAGAVTLTDPGSADIASLLASLNGDAVTAGLPAGLFVEGTLSDTLELDSAVYAAASNNVGADQFVEVVSAPAELNLTAGMYTGVVGDSFRVEAAKELRDGYDGDDPADADFLAAFNTANALMNRLRSRNLGLVKLATPGVNATQIQKAGLQYASFRNYQYRLEIPANITSETSAIDYVNNTIGRNDYGKVSFPSYAQVVNKTGNGSTLQSLTGAIHGREAKMARDWAGYHKAAAGEEVTLPNVVKLTTGEEELDGELLNPQGLNLILKKKGNFVLWGDRTISLKPEWQFAHAREYISHIENVLIENFDWVIFALNDPKQRELLVPVFTNFFNPEWQKRAIVGPKLADAAKIKIDSENNTPLTTAAGDLNSELDLDVVDVVERFIISISKAGVTSSAA